MIVDHLCLSQIFCRQSAAESTAFSSPSLPKSVCRKRVNARGWSVSLEASSRLLATCGDRDARHDCMSLTNGNGMTDGTGSLAEICGLIVRGLRARRSEIERAIGSCINSSVPHLASRDDPDYGLYGPLLDAPLHHIDAAITAAVPSDGLPEIFALGSCQCVGWAAQLRGLLEALEVSGQQALGLRRMEVDIVHPDTASGRLGTHMIGAREEDPRDNLRPGVSQLQTSMRRFPGVQSVNTVSLRVLTQPPGYQICRFFTEAKLSVRDVREGLERARCVLPEMVETTTTPIDSRAFARTQHVAMVITAPSHLTVGQIAGTDLSIVTMQSYVHNTIGYCRSILSTAGRLLTAAPVAALAAIDTPVGAATGA